MSNLWRKKMVPRNDWEFNVLDIYNYKKSGKLEEYFNFIERHHDYLEGDILEAGVYNGRTLLATALFLKELKSDKLVYGFDSFTGFNSIHENDHIEKFDGLLDTGRITENHYMEVRKSYKLKEYLEEEKIDPLNISTSGDFSNVNMKTLYKKIEMLQLSNIRLVSGYYKSTMTTGTSFPSKIMAALLDCDLYMSYKIALPFIWDRLVQHGYIFLDEYYSLKFPGARIATDEFFIDKDDKPRKYKTKLGDFERWYVRKIYG